MVTLDTLHSYATWLANGSSSAGLGSDPTNRTSPAQLGFTSTASRVAETVLQWGKIDDVVFSTGFANFGLANYVVPGPQYFIVTSYSFPSPQDTYTTGYLLYIWFPGASGGGTVLAPGMAAESHDCVSEGISLDNWPVELWLRRAGGLFPLRRRPEKLFPLPASGERARGAHRIDSLNTERRGKDLSKGA